MYEPAYKCRNWTCKGCVRIQNTYCEPCFLVTRGIKSWIRRAYLLWTRTREITEGEAVALMKEYAA